MSSRKPTLQAQSRETGYRGECGSHFVHKWAHMWLFEVLHLECLFLFLPLGTQVGRATFLWPLWLLTSQEEVSKSGRLVISIRFIVCDHLHSPFGSWARNREKWWPWQSYLWRDHSGPADLGSLELSGLRHEVQVHFLHFKCMLAEFNGRCVWCRVALGRCWSGHPLLHTIPVMASDLWAARKFGEFLCPPKYSLSLIQLL